MSETRNGQDGPSADSDPDDLEKSAQACLRNAAELLRAAEDVLQIPRISFHLSTLALEEVGKAHLLRLARVARERDDEMPSFVTRSLDNHVRKLFFAFWGPTIGRDLITRKQIEEHQGLAQSIHDIRVRGLYVDLSADRALQVPDDVIPNDQARSMLEMTRARLEMEKGAEPGPLAPESREVMTWFFTATEDPEKRRVIFGSRSMAKLAESERPSVWIRWLKEEFDKAAAEARALVERELARVPLPSSDPRALNNKWKLKIRLYSRSHSIRQNQLNKHWNDGVNWIKLNAVTGGHEQKRQLDLEILLPGIPVGAVWEAGFAVARRVVAALNIGSLGFLWWNPPGQQARFYETLTDLESNRAMRLERSPALSIDWRRDALKGGEIHNALLVLAMLNSFKRPAEREPIETHYYAGLTFLAKTDIHMTFEAHACTAFYEALRTAFRVYDNVSAQDMPEKLRAWITDLLPDLEAEQRDGLIRLGETLVNGQLPDNPVTLQEVGTLKIFCDAYFVSTFKRLEPERLGPPAEKSE